MLQWGQRSAPKPGDGLAGCGESLELSMLPSKEVMAKKALRNGITRTRNHLLAGNIPKALAALDAASATARRWETGTHAESHRCSD